MPHPDDMLRRQAMAHELTQAGYPTSPATLATMAAVAVAPRTSCTGASRSIRGALDSHGRGPA
jgi:hypothetical protein